MEWLTGLLLGSEPEFGPEKGELESAKEDYFPEPTPFFFRPSVGTWMLQPPVVLEAASVPTTGAALPVAGEVEAAPAEPPHSIWSLAAPPSFARDFRLLPSVGTWLQLGALASAPAAAGREAAKAELSSPSLLGGWQADFEAAMPSGTGVTQANFEPEGMAPSNGAPSATASRTARARRYEVPASPAAGTPGSTIGMFKLAPPPSPGKTIAVGSSPTTAATEILLIEVDEEEVVANPEDEGHRISWPTHEDLIGTNRAYDDDELLLLGDDSGQEHRWAPSGRRTTADGVDSPSDSDAEDTVRHGSARTAADVPRASLRPAALDAPQEVPPAQPRPPPQTAADDATSAMPVPVVLEGAERLPAASAGGGGASPPSTTSGTARLASRGRGPEEQDFQPSAAGQGPANRGWQPGPSGGPSPEQSAPDFHSLVYAALDRVFGDTGIWPQVVTAERNSLDNTPRPSLLKRGERRYKVQVPTPYPGVQYRRSKRLDDRYTRYAEDGAIVQGIVEADGEWLKLSSDNMEGGREMYLPLRVGDVPLLHEIPSESSELAGQSKAAQGRSWFSCCQTAVSTIGEVVVEQDSPSPTAGPRQLAECVSRNSPSTVHAAHRQFSDPINTFVDTERAMPDRPGHQPPRQSSTGVRPPWEDGKNTPVGFESSQVDAVGVFLG